MNVSVGSSDSLEGLKFELWEAVLWHLKIIKICLLRHELHTKTLPHRQQTGRKNKNTCPSISVPKERQVESGPINSVGKN